MKTYRVLLAVLLVVFVALAAMTTAVQAADDSFDLAVIAIESNPPSIKVGQETSFFVRYQNVGSAAAPKDIKLDLALKVTYKETDEEIGSCREEVSGVSGLQPDEIEEHHFGKECDVIFRAEGTHQVRVAFVPSGTSEEDAFSGSYPPIEGDVDATNNGQTEDVTAGPYESNLPDELGRLLAGLGMFFAVMAIMAAGTEVVIDTLKVTLGMKSKVTAMEALERLEKLMPGQLATLGVGAASQEQFSNLTQKMRETVQPVSEIPDVVKKVQSGDIDALFGLLEDLGVESGEIEKLRADVKKIQDVTSQSFGGVRDQIVQAIGYVVTGLGKRKGILQLDVKQEVFLSGVETRLVTIKGDLGTLNFPTGGDVQQFIAGFKKLRDEWYALRTLISHEVQTWSAQATVDWLEKQRKDLLKMSSEEVMAAFDVYVKPQLEELDNLLKILGVEEQAGKAREMLQNELGIAFARADAETKQYVKSLSNLLQGVEARRFEIQSPLRKWWRRLRSGGALWGFLVIWLSLTVVMALIIHIVQTAKFAEWGFWPYSVLPGALVSVVVIILFSLVGWGIYSVKGYSNDAESTSPCKLWDWLLIGTKWPTPLDLIEVFWNWLRGDPALDPTKFKQPKRFEKLAAVSATGDKDAKEIPLNSENAAQVVFLRTNQQQDEEKSRLRWLRAISVLVGLVLAYILQIDAAQLLDYAVPGIGATINKVFYISGQQLCDTLRWQWLDPKRAISAGIILTGFAAAAGSKFWHDRITQLQAAKKGAESAAELVSQAKQIAGSLEQNREV